ncbi:MAG: methionyl-tRNA formyltransferase [Cardiobacteriaceae bacterium]|nr:methionyl-tRNA formyltransferase [Cardiobacteriaceae bacterium]
MSARLWFAGTPAFAAHSLQALIEAGSYHIDGVLTQPDRPAGRGRKLTASAVKEMALQYAIPVAQLEKLQQDMPPFVELSRPDLVIVAAYGLLLPSWFLAYPRHGCINIHASLLPRWRGAAPIQRAIEAGDKETGICIMQMDQGLDTGAVWQEARLPILADDTAASLHDRLMLLGSETLLATLPDILTQKRQPIAQATEGVSYAHKLSKAEARIDWQNPISLIARQIRAYNPVPVAHCELDGALLRIFNAEILTESTNAAAGMIIRHDENGLSIACIDGVLRVTRLQFPGKTATDAASLRHSRNLTGKRLL